MEWTGLRSGASSSASEEEWTNDEFKAKNGKEDQEPAPKGCSAYALTDRCSDPRAQQRGNDRECGQSNISTWKAPPRAKPAASAIVEDRERQSQCLDKIIFGKTDGLEIGNGGITKTPVPPVIAPVVNPITGVICPWACNDPVGSTAVV